LQSKFPLFPPIAISPPFSITVNYFRPKFTSTVLLLLADLRQSYLSNPAQASTTSPKTPLLDPRHTTAPTQPQPPSFQLAVLQ